MKSGVKLHSYLSGVAVLSVLGWLGTLAHSQTKPAITPVTSPGGQGSGASAPSVTGTAQGATDAVYKPLPKGTLNFNKHIAPIMFENCSSCHRPGEVAPFSLLSYQDIKKRAQQVVLVAEDRSMPPWKADV